MLKEEKKKRSPQAGILQKYAERNRFGKFGEFLDQAYGADITEATSPISYGTERTKQERASNFSRETKQTRTDVNDTGIVPKNIDCHTRDDVSVLSFWSSATRPRYDRTEYSQTVNFHELPAAREGLTLDNEDKQETDLDRLDIGVEGSCAQMHDVFDKGHLEIKEVGLSKELGLKMKEKEHFQDGMLSSHSQVEDDDIKDTIEELEKKVFRLADKILAAATNAAGSLPQENSGTYNSTISDEENKNNEKSVNPDQHNTKDKEESFDDLWSKLVLDSDREDNDFTANGDLDINEVESDLVRDARYRLYTDSLKLVNPDQHNTKDKEESSGDMRRDGLYKDSSVGLYDDIFRSSNSSRVDVSNVNEEVWEQMTDFSARWAEEEDDQQNGPKAKNKKCHRKKAKVFLEKVVNKGKERGGRHESDKYKFGDFTVGIASMAEKHMINRSKC